MKSRKNTKSEGRKNTPLGGVEKLLAQFELCDKASVSLDIYTFEIIELTAARTYHLQKTASAVVVLLMRLQVLGKVIDTPGQQRNLYLGATRVALVRRKLGDDFRLYILVHFLPPTNVFAPNFRICVESAKPSIGVSWALLEFYPIELYHTIFLFATDCNRF